MTEKPQILIQYVAAISATIGVVVIGTILGYASPAGAILTSNFTDSSLHLTSFQNSWFTSISNVGAMIGCPIAGLSINILGRRGTIIYSAVPVLIGWIIIVFAQNFVMLLVGRVITGIYCSLISLAVPTYIAEFSSPHIRGILGTFFQIMLVTGILFSYSLGALLQNFRWIAAICAIVPCLCSLLMIPNKESPLYLLSKGREEEAEKAMQYFRGKDFEGTKTELHAMKISLEESKKSKVSFDSLRLGYVLKPFLISLGLMFFQQFSGITAVTFNFNIIFKNIGGKLSESSSSIIVSIIQLISSIAGAFFIDKFGRKILLVSSALFMSAPLITFGVFFYLQKYYPETAKEITWLPMVSYMVFLIAFSYGYGPIPWLMMGELFSPEIKEIAGSISSFSNWAFAFIVTFVFVPLQSEVHTFGVFWIFAGICVLNLIFVISFVYETKGKTLQEINAHFGGPVIRTEQ